MRTRTLLCMAALTAAGLATSLAQSNVYSLNIVGYVTYTNVPGFRMIANPLSATNNTVASIFQNPPNGLTIYKRNSSGTGFDSSTYDPDLAAFDNPSLSLVPGEGAFIQNPSGANYVNTFVGEVVLNSTNPVPNGFSIRSSVIPQSGGIQTALLYPVQFGDTIYQFIGNGYNSSTYDPDLAAWDNGEPVPKVGESFWIQNPNPTKNWVRNFSVGP